MIQHNLFDQDKRQAGISGVNCEASTISIAIVSYNSRELLRDCLASIEPERWQQVTVVDNASSDGSEDMVRQDFPWVQFIISRKNNGYGAGANLAIASCSSKYVLLLNCDTVLQPGALEALSNYLDQHAHAAIAGPHLMNPDGTSQVSCFQFPTPLQILLKETSLSRFLWRYSKPCSTDLLDESHPVVQAVPWVLGAALAIRRLAFDSVGGFDESFFMYFEEVDLCYRLSTAGWQTHFVPTARVTHLGRGSTQQHRAAMAVQFYKSLFHFYRRHYSGSQRFQLRYVLTYLMLRNIVRDSFRLSRAKNPFTNRDADNLLVWRSVLFNVWSANGWLNHESVLGDGS